MAYKNIHIKKNPIQYDPHNLPKAIDFHLATKDLPLERGAKAKIQVALSKMERKEVKETIEYLSDMRYTALKKVPPNYKMAAYCKAVKEFVEKYFYSLKVQKKV